MRSPISFSVYILFCFLLLVHCSRPERNNIFDAGSKNYIPPPEGSVTQFYGLYAVNDGRLVGFGFVIEFVEELTLNYELQSHLVWGTQTVFRDYTSFARKGDKTFTVELVKRFGEVSPGNYVFSTYYAGAEVAEYHFTVEEPGPHSLSKILAFEDETHSKSIWKIAVPEDITFRREWFLPGDHATIDPP